MKVLGSLAAAVALAGCGKAADKAANKEEIKRVFLEHHEAMISGDIPRMKKHLAAEQVREMDREAGSQELAVQFLQHVVPKEIRVTGADVVGDIGSLVVRGVDDEGQNVEGRALLSREGGSWKITKLNWTVKSD